MYPRMSCSLHPEGNGILGNCKAETFYEHIIGKSPSESHLARIHHLVSKALL